MRINKTIVLAAGAVFVVGCSAAVISKDNTKSDIRSGYSFMTPETREIQDDDFANPAFVNLDYGADLWSDVSGSEGKSCETCHADAEVSMKGVGPVYPRYDEDLGKLINLEQQINECREQRMGAKPYKYESPELLGMTIYVRNQSSGMPMNVAIDGPAAPFFEKGKEFYFKRRGSFDMACSSCHVDNAGMNIRANLLTQGQSNGFPTYRLKWTGPGSIHRRFRGCNKTTRSTPYAYGSDEYVNLELFVAWKGRGLPVETPAVRN